MIRGKSYRATATDIAEGYVTVNPLFLKPLGAETLKALYQEVLKIQGEARGEKFPHSNAQGIRLRNLKLQRLQSAMTVIRNFARERRIPIA
ncbi:MAG: hypothetical protein Q8J64_00305 [Thermodesulfovibrionales bacterium]|nr:hypothetical protein [Thermodesulfovibrionales bacterium]